MCYLKTIIVGLILGLFFISSAQAATETKPHLLLAGAESTEAKTANKKDRPNYEKKYLRTYKRHGNKFGKRAPGRNIVFDGFRANSGKVRQAKKAEVKEATQVMKSALLPVVYSAQTESAPEVPYQEEAPAAAPASASGSGGVNSDLESIAQCESGGDYNAVNPSSGAYGKYQIMPSTAAGYGCDLATPAGQDQCASEIYSREGSSPWVC
jgi:hypothetical protein